MNGHEESKLTTTAGSVQRIQRGRIVLELPASRCLDESEAPACIPTLQAPTSDAPICYPYEVTGQSDSPACFPA
jgi:hypothetical protein